MRHLLNEQTHRDIASLAAKGLRHPETLTNAQIQKVCASALAQAPEHLLPSDAKPAQIEAAVGKALNG